MSPAGDLDDPPVGARVDSVVAAERVCLQVSGEVLEKLSRAVSSAILREIVDVVGKREGANVDPAPSRVAPWFVTPQYGHWCVSRPDHRGLAHQFLLKLV